MADYTIDIGDRGAYELALGANTEDMVTFARDVDVVEIKVMGGAPSPVYFTLDASVATVKGGHCYDALPGTGVQVQPETPGPTVVRLISAGAATYSVSAAA